MFTRRQTFQLFAGAAAVLALPTAGRDERTAALLSGIALALVWDPGDD